MTIAQAVQKNGSRDRVATEVKAGIGRVEKKETGLLITVPAPNFKTLKLEVTGTAPLAPTGTFGAKIFLEIYSGNRL